MKWHETLSSKKVVFLYLKNIYIYIYINDLITNNLKSNAKLFPDDTSLFSEICDPLENANVLNDDLRKIREWAETIENDF